MVASGSLFIAEQCIDRQARTDLFRGRQVELATGRVLLHAIDSAGRRLRLRPRAPDTGRAAVAGQLPAASSALPWLRAAG